jgi:arylsulfatase A-like enzyme
MRTICLSCVLVAVAASAFAAGPADRPNILFIMSDDHAAQAVSAYGSRVNSTPNIDRIAREGVRFDQAVCTTPFCSPTRASIITGLYPHKHGIVTNVFRRDYPAFPSPPTEEGIHVADVTTEKLLHEAGYATHHYGKWHLADEDLPYYTDMYGEHHEYDAEMADVFAAVRKRDRATWMDWYGWALPVEQTAAFRQAVEGLGEKWKVGMLLDFGAKMGRSTLPLAQDFDVRVAVIIDAMRKSSRAGQRVPIEF